MSCRLVRALLFISVLGCSGAVTRQELYDLIQSGRYDANEPPPADKPTDVSVGLYVNTATFDKDNQRMVWDLYLRQSWNDSRLTSLFDNEDESITMGQGHWRHIWYPDFLFRNSIEVVQHSAPAEQVFLRIRQKSLWMVHMLKITTSCTSGGFHRTIVCPFLIESFKYTKDDVIFSWLPSPVEFSPDISLPFLILKTYILYDCSVNYTSGSFPCLEIRFVLKYASTHSLVTTPRLVFAMGVFLVIVSWFSFWIDGDQFAERLGILLGVAATLLLLGIGLHVKDDLDYPTSTAYVFLGAFLLFVLAAMLEYVIVYGVLTYIPAKLKSARKDEIQPSTSRDKIARMIDIVCGLVIFPVLFFLFVVCYAALGGI